jgi:hypothetical protein
MACPVVVAAGQPGTSRAPIVFAQKYEHEDDKHGTADRCDDKIFEHWPIPLNHSRLLIGNGINVRTGRVSAIAPQKAMGTKRTVVHS